MVRSRSRKRWLWVSLVNNLALLGTFKYAGFLVDNLNWLLAKTPLPFQLATPDFLLPVGISFYTFQSMSYTIDFYRGNVHRERNFFRFAAFVSLFPQLVAGPIERAKSLLPQLKDRPRVGAQDVSEGASLFVVGLFKKVALADYLALYVDPIYATPDRLAAPALMLGTFAFAWQIYFDFSGYTDMARGIARAFGFRLMLNFRHPYLATSLGDFWARWHISLSTWFRDYVYIPLGGNRHGRWRTYQNLLLTMMISGLWHGAAWTFIVWGAIHALATVAMREAEHSGWYRSKVPRIAKQLLVFAIVWLAWVFFRAESVSDAWLILTRIATSSWTDPEVPFMMLGLVLGVWAYQQICESPVRRILDWSVMRVALVVGMLLYLLTIPGSQGNAFIYFQF